MSRPNLKEISRAMSQPADLCRNKVQAELKEATELCRDIVEEVCEEDFRDTLNSIVTLIKANGSGTLSRQSLLYSNIKE